MIDDVEEKFKKLNTVIDSVKNFLKNSPDSELTIPGEVGQRMADMKQMFLDVKEKFDETKLGRGNDVKHMENLAEEV